jgi:hypothetical protein
MALAPAGGRRQRRRLDSCVRDGGDVLVMGHGSGSSIYMYLLGLEATKLSKHQNQAFNARLAS